MNTDNVSTKNRRGRPATGTNPVIGVRLPPDLLKALDRWRREQADPPGRPEAIRRLIEASLSRQVEAKPTAPSGGSPPGSAQKPASPAKTTAPRAKKPTASDRQASPAQTKEAQIRALREQGAIIRSEP